MAIYWPLMPGSRVQPTSSCLSSVYSSRNSGSAGYVHEYTSVSPLKDRGTPFTPETSFSPEGRKMRYRLHIKRVYTYMAAPCMWPHEWSGIRYAMAFSVLVDIWWLPLDSNFMAFTGGVVLEIYPLCPSADLSPSQTCLKIEMEYFFSSQVISRSCQEFVTVCESLLAW